MLKNAFRKQNGFTLIELLTAIVIAAVSFTTIVTIWRSAVTINRNTNNQATATNQLKNAFNYISRDTEQAAIVTTTGVSPNTIFPLTLSWGQNTTTPTRVIYSIVNGILQRNYTGPDGPSTLNVANNVSSDTAKTNCSWDNVNHNLAINMTISLGSISAARQFILTPRVVQFSSQTTDIVSLALSPNPSTYGSGISLTATVSPSTSSGTITFLDGGNTIGISPIVNGTTTYPVSNLSVGGHSIVAVYSGDAVYTANTSSVLNQTVNKAPTTLVLVSSLNPSASGQSVTFSATVSPGTATGVVQFSVDGTYLGSAVTLNNGTASSGAIATLSIGSHNVTAVYSGDGNYIASTAVLTQTVTKIPTTVTLSSSAPYSAFGQSVTFTAAISPGAATGTVQFKIDGTNFGSLVSIASGSASSNSTNTLAVGTHSITAVYSGDSNYNGSSSSTLTQNVTNVTAAFNPTSGSVSTVITVTGSGWAVSDTISSVTVGGTTASKTLSVSSSGNLSGTITVPTLTLGLKDIIITGQLTGAKTFTGVFRVIPTVTNVGQNSSTSSSTSINVTVPTGGVATGNTVIVTFAMSSVTGTVTVSDTKGNSYTSDADVNYSGYLRTLVFSAPITNALVSGNMITVTYPTATLKAVSICYVSNLISASRVDKTATKTGSSTSPSSNATATTTQASEFIIGAIGYNNNSTFTAGGSFTALTKSSASSSLTIQPEYQIVNSTGAYTASGSIATSGRWAAAIVTYKTQ